MHATLLICISIDLFIYVCIYIFGFQHVSTVGLTRLNRRNSKGVFAYSGDVLGLTLHPNLIYCTPPRCSLQSILRNIRFPPAPPVLPFNIQYRTARSRGQKL